jgi:hypothetical protein
MEQAEVIILVCSLFVMLPMFRCLVGDYDLPKVQGVTIAKLEKFIWKLHMSI